jgi:hypothetical protein
MNTTGCLFNGLGERLNSREVKAPDLIRRLKTKTEVINMCNTAARFGQCDNI